MKIAINTLQSGDGDWIGLYINGVLVDEGHELSPAEIFKAISKYFDFSFEDFYDEKESYLERFGGRCPKKLPTPEELKYE